MSRFQVLPQIFVVSNSDYQIKNANNYEPKGSSTEGFVILAIEV
mgnify:CR=1 FL=1